MASAPLPYPVRVRFCPSPTGNPHVGLVRTALFNWAFARHHGGTLVFRIEDTDAARDSEESYEQLLDAMRWLGLDWDEGPGTGGPHAPYRQSERMDIYADVARRLEEAGYAYKCYCSTEELDARRNEARAAGRPSGYDGKCRALTQEEIAAYRAEERTPVVRFRMPDEPITFTDLVRGELTFTPENVPDFGIVRANGAPLYTLVNPVDDALMEITHVLRGEDLLSSTPRQIALYRALAEIGVGNGTVPQFGHLPYVMGEGNKKLSKRDPQSSLNLYRERGFLPEGLLNYLSLLGWSLAEDRDVFSMDEMVAAFDIADVNANPARFDLKKCEAINAAHLRALPADEFANRLLPFLFPEEEPTAEQLELLARAAPLTQERMVVLGEVTGMLGFLFVAPDEFRVDEADAAKVLTPEARPVLEASVEVLRDLRQFTPGPIQAALRTALVDGLGIKPKHAFTPLRVAVTGRRVSPPLFESMELLGHDETMRRLTAALERVSVS
ncbi:glutamate--tRNA ligase [Streptomyces sp. WAC 00631]|uniref:glutamate--tRNA ligase n=1 Tax=unclassified Streptomyces TaxID=2593676 RepID=UPI000F795DF5|nr:MULTISPECIES: glutamate--tRNA ligase [unclassified Streptomyces]MCC5035726.1 glutamate--tRNA ligase [Streptomyces sp. WAC 00631]MCC9739223.1 glutamate--tRNA ligase [Streptomyces sp. MNU89]